MNGRSFACFGALALLIIMVSSRCRAETFYVYDGKDLTFAKNGDPDQVQPDHWAIWLYKRGEQRGGPNHWGAIAGESPVAVKDELASEQQTETLFVKAFPNAHGGLVTYTTFNPLGPVAIMKPPPLAIPEILSRLVTIQKKVKKYREYYKKWQLVVNGKSGPKNPFRNSGKLFSEYATQLEQVGEYARILQESADDTVDKSQGAIGRFTDALDQMDKRFGDVETQFQQLSKIAEPETEDGANILGKEFQSSSARSSFAIALNDGILEINTRETIVHRQVHFQFQVDASINGVGVPLPNHPEEEEEAPPPSEMRFSYRVQLCDLDPESLTVEPKQGSDEHPYFLMVLKQRQQPEIRNEEGELVRPQGRISFQGQGDESFKESVSLTFASRDDAEAVSSFLQARIARLQPHEEAPSVLGKRSTPNGNVGSSLSAPAIEKAEPKSGTGGYPPDGPGYQPNGPRAYEEPPHLFPSDETSPSKKLPSAPNPFVAVLQGLKPAAAGNDPRSISGTRAAATKVAPDVASKTPSGTFESASAPAYEQAYACLQQGHSARALQFASEAILLAPDDYRGYFFAGVALQRQDDEAKALERFNLALKLAPADQRAYIQKWIDFEQRRFASKAAKAVAQKQEWAARPAETAAPTSTSPAVPASPTIAPAAAPSKTPSVVSFKDALTEMIDASESAPWRGGLKKDQPFKVMPPSATTCFFRESDTCVGIEIITYFHVSSRAEADKLVTTIQGVLPPQYSKWENRPVEKTEGQKETGAWYVARNSETFNKTEVWISLVPPSVSGDSYSVVLTVSSSIPRSHPEVP